MDDLANKDLTLPSAKEKMPNYEITLKEKHHLEKYRKLDDHGKTLVDTVLDIESNRIKNQPSLESETPKFITNTVLKFINYPYAQHMAFAGEGFYFDDLSTDIIEAPEYPGADFVIGVNGDSMEPTFYNNDNVYVKKTCELNYGDIGLFIMDNSIYLKEYNKRGLLSHNKLYPIVPARNDIRIIGKVLGKVSKDAKIIRK